MRQSCGLIDSKICLLLLLHLGKLEVLLLDQHFLKCLRVKGRLPLLASKAPGLLLAFMGPLLLLVEDEF